PAVLPMGWNVERSVEFHTLAVRPLPVLPPPPDIVIRSFQLGVDEESWLGANTDAFSHHPDQGNLSRADLLARMNEPWFDAKGFLLAERDRAIIGFCWTKISESNERLTTTPGGERVHAVDGEIYAIGVVPDAHGIGLGRNLLISGLRSLAQHGATRWSLYVESDNLPARALYESLGFQRSAVQHMYRVAS
ncbi:MAG: GNAT family N-acetyltransferase, partial [Acidimicrobiia bacterium]